MGTVSFDANDPSSIEAAIHSVNRMVDERLGRYASNPIVEPIIDQMKETYRENLLEKAAEARLMVNEDK